MSKRRGRSRDKVRRFLTWLETRQQIIQQKDNTTTTITIENYEIFQSNDTPNKHQTIHQTNTKQTPNDTQHKKDNNNKKENNNNKEIKISKKTNDSNLDINLLIEEIKKICNDL